MKLKNSKSFSSTSIQLFWLKVELRGLYFIAYNRGARYLLHKLNLKRVKTNISKNHTALIS